MYLQGGGKILQGGGKIRKFEKINIQEETNQVVGMQISRDYKKIIMAKEAFSKNTPFASNIYGVPYCVTTVTRVLNMEGKLLTGLSFWKTSAPKNGKKKLR